MKKVKLMILVGLILICCGCDGNVTRDIRHGGFTLGGEFQCDVLVPDNEDDTTYEKIKYYRDGYVITENGDIYEISSDKKFSNGDYCKKAKIDFKVDTVFDNIAKGNDGKYYYLTAQNNAKAYTTVEDTDNSLALYKLLLDDTNNLKVQKVDNNTGSYYILKKDGNVYNYIITKENSNSQYKIVSSDIAFDKSNLSGNIIDFAYYGENLNTFVKTEDSVYRMRAKNRDECEKYADVTCKYEMKEDELFKTHKDKILTYNGGTLITTYGKMFTVAF